MFYFVFAYILITVSTAEFRISLSKFPYISCFYRERTIVLKEGNVNTAGYQSYVVEIETSVHPYAEISCSALNSGGRDIRVQINNR